MAVKKRKSAPKSWAKWGLVLLPIGGLGLGIWWAMPRPQPPTFAEISGMLPETAEVTLTIDLERQSWSFLDKLVSPQAQAIWQRPIDQSPFQTLLRQTGMDWQRDVKPWSKGIIGVALLGNQEDESTATVLLAPSRNRRGGREFLARYRQSLGNNFTEQTYEGVSYYQLQGNSDRNDVTAEVKNYVIITSHPQALFQIVDVLQNRRKSLQDLSFLSDDLKGKALVQGVVRSNTQLFEQKNDKTEPAFEALTFSLSPLVNGLKIEAHNHFRQPLPPIPDRSSKLIGLLPEDTFLFLSGWQIGESWSFVQKSFPNNETIKQIQTTIADNTPFNLQQDILGWMQGEFAIGAIPAQDGIIGKTAGFGLVFLAEAEQEGSRRFFDQLDRLAVASEGGILPRGVTLEARPDKTLWQVGKSIAASHGAIGQTVFWAMGELGNKLNSGAKLPDSAKFQALTTAMKPENGGYFYLDMTVARTIFSQRIAPSDWQQASWFQDTMTVLNTIEGVVFTHSQINDRTTKLEGKIILGQSS